jgi:hypothetical protein
MLIFPNPSRGIVTVELENAASYKGEKWNMLNTLGQVTQSGSVSGNPSFTINFSGQPAGTYFLIVRNQSIPIILIE